VEPLAGVAKVGREFAVGGGGRRCCRSGKVGEAGAAGAVVEAGAHVHREAAHLARRPKERTAAHRRQLLQSPLFAPLVLKPHLKHKQNTNISKNVKIPKITKSLILKCDNFLQIKRFN
jgi:hypothetical protein